MCPCVLRSKERKRWKCAWTRPAVESHVVINTAVAWSFSYNVRDVHDRSTSFSAQNMNEDQGFWVQEKVVFCPRRRVTMSDQQNTKDWKMLGSWPSTLSFLGRLRWRFLSFSIYEIYFLRFSARSFRTLLWRLRSFLASSWSSNCPRRLLGHRWRWLAEKFHQFLRSVFCCLFCWTMTAVVLCGRND